LSFYLSWSSKSPESLEEMDTKELVEIFKMDPDSVNPKLTDKLIKHFKSKIAKREETMIDNGETYFDIIFSIFSNECFIIDVDFFMYFAPEDIVDM